MDFYLPPLAQSIFVLVFGLVVGSFLNVVIYRLPRERSVVRPRSACTDCHAPIAWYQNIPVLSYLVLRGRCGSCGTRISARYPLIEILTAFLFLMSWRGLGLDVAQFRIWFFLSITIAIIFIDLDFRIIPDELSLGGWVIGLLTAYWDFRLGTAHLFIASIVGFGFFFGLGLLYERMTGRTGLGGGDIKFMGTIGAFLGLGGIWSTLLISSIVGSIVGIAWVAWQKRKNPNDESLMKTAIPYGPFLVLGAWIELFFEASRWMNL